MANIEATIGKAMNNTVPKVYDTKSIKRYRDIKKVLKAGGMSWLTFGLI